MQIVTNSQQQAKHSGSVSIYKWTIYKRYVISSISYAKITPDYMKMCKLN